MHATHPWVHHKVVSHGQPVFCHFCFAVTVKRKWQKTGRTCETNHKCHWLVGDLKVLHTCWISKEWCTSSTDKQATGSTDLIIPTAIMRDITTSESFTDRTLQHILSINAYTSHFYLVRCRWHKLMHLSVSELPGCWVARSCPLLSRPCSATLPSRKLILQQHRRLLPHDCMKL